MSIEAMKAALNVLEADREMVDYSDSHNKIIYDLRQAIEKAQEPLAWLVTFTASNGETDRMVFLSLENASSVIDQELILSTEPLYTAPPDRDWVGLTYEDYENKQHWGKKFVVGAQWAETTLKEKNT